MLGGFQGLPCSLVLVSLVRLPHSARCKSVSCVGLWTSLVWHSRLQSPIQILLSKCNAFHCFFQFRLLSCWHKILRFEQNLIHLLPRWHLAREVKRTSGQAGKVCCFFHANKTTSFSRRLAFQPDKYVYTRSLFTLVTANHLDASISPRSIQSVH